MSIQRKQNLERLFDKAFEGLAVPAGGAVRLHLSDGTVRQFAYKDHNQEAMNRMVRECKKKGLYVRNIETSGNVHIDRVNDFLRALGGIAGCITVRANGVGGNYVVYLKPKH